MINITGYSFSCERNSSIHTVLEMLQQYGIAHIPQFLETGDAQLLQKEFYQLLDYKGPAYIGPPKMDGYRGSKSVVASRIKRELLTHDEFPLVVSLFSLNIFQQISDLFFSQPFLFNEIIMLSRHTPDRRPILPLHFDRQQHLKFYLYVKDTTKADGAFEFVPGSHGVGRQFRIDYESHGQIVPEFQNDVPESHPLFHQVIPIEARLGDLIIFDTDGFHRGGVVAEGHERLVIRGHSHLTKR